MSSFKLYDEDELREKKEFVSEKYKNLTFSQHADYTAISKRFWGITTQVQKCKREIITQEELVASLESKQSNIPIWLGATAVLILVVQYVKNINSIEIALSSLAIAGYFGWHALIRHESIVFASSEIQNNKRMIALLNVTLADLELHSLPNFSEYTAAQERYEDHKYDLSKLSESEQFTIRRFNIELDLAILKRLGYEYSPLPPPSFR